DKRFEEARADTNARFEQVDRRFEEMRADMNARFQQVDKRFEEMRTDMNARFRTHEWILGVGLTLLVALMSVFEFVT
ncbi:MAG: hypothetical protein ACOCYC_05180, partial [bacterium]